jgi:Flp pilus assembly protein TadG
MRVRVERTRRFVRSERGAALVEFGLIVPFFLLLFLAMLDFGFALYTGHAVAASVREGARLAAVLSDVAENDVRVRNVTTNAFNRMRATSALMQPATVVVRAPTAANEYTIRVSTSYVYQAITPLAGFVGLTNMTLGRSANFYWEHAPAAAP